MQRETSQPPAVPSTSTAVPRRGQLASMPIAPNKKDTGRSTVHKSHRKPSISQVILETVADKGARQRVSLAALKKAVANTGYNMAHVAGRFKRVLKALVNKGMLKQVTGKGTSGSFRIGKVSKAKLKVKARQQPRFRQTGRRRPGQRQLKLGSRKGQKHVRRGTRSHRCHN